LAIQVKISEQDNDLLRELLVEKYGDKAYPWRGLLMKELGLAIRSYVRLERLHRHDTLAQTQRTFNITKEEDSKIPAAVVKSVHEMIAFLEREYYPEGNIRKEYSQETVPVHLKHLTEAIIHVRCKAGGDDRTVQKWLGILRKYNLIRECSTNLFEFAPFIDNDRTESGSNDNISKYVDVKAIQRRQRENKEREKQPLAVAVKLEAN
jgi:hypothetical protein